MSAERLSDGALEFKKLYQLSFIFSEGSIGSQEKIFKWLVAKDYMKQKDFEEARQSLYEIKPPPNHIERSEAQIHEAHTGAISRLEGVFEELSRPCTDITEIEVKLVKSLIKLEREVVKNGRVEKNHLNDRYGSFVREYILLGKHIGNNYFDELLTNLKPILLNLHNSDNCLNGLVAHWEHHHTGEKFFET